MKKHILLLLLFLATLPITAFAQRTIRSVVIRFTTTSDDKDWDSFIRFQLQSSNGTWLATQEGTFGGSFPNGSTYAYSLNLGSPTYPDYFLNNTYLFMFMQPNGDDTWNFAWELTVYFSDGSYRSNSGTGGLSDERQSFRLQVF